MACLSSCCIVCLRCSCRRDSCPSVNIIICTVHSNIIHDFQVPNEIRNFHSRFIFHFKDVELNFPKWIGSLKDTQLTRQTIFWVNKFGVIYIKMKFWSNIIGTMRFQTNRPNWCVFKMQSIFFNPIRAKKLKCSQKKLQPHPFFGLSRFTSF